MSFDFTTLKARHRALRGGFPEALALRTHRALSWLQRAEREVDPYVFKPFWDYQVGDIREADWKREFERSKAAAHRALGRQDKLRVLAALLDRLYVLRNQLVHGGATWNSAVNRDQVRDGVAILGLLVPVVIHLMMEMPDLSWEAPCYPVVQ